MSREAGEARVRPGIIHFTADGKPWLRKSRHPLGELYWMWRNATPWTESRRAKWQRQMYTWMRDAERSVRHWRYGVMGRRTNTALG